jgi:hypothetical protein
MIFKVKEIFIHLSSMCIATEYDIQGQEILMHVLSMCIVIKYAIDSSFK